MARQVRPQQRGSRPSLHGRPQGFRRPTTTPVPDELFDQYLEELSGAELKVLLYIIRRTLGFKKNRDPISFNQFLKGIQTRDGRVLDKGCGVKSSSTLSMALDALYEKGLINRWRRRDERGENEVTVYSLRFDGEDGCEGEEEDPRVADSGGPNGVLRISKDRTSEIAAKGTAKSEGPVLRESHQHETVKQQTVHREKQQQIRSLEHAVEVDESVVVALTDLGVSTKTARDLTNHHPMAQIRSQIDMLGYRKADDPAAVLVKAIREEWAPPAGYKTPEQREVEAREVERVQSELEAWRQARAELTETEDTVGSPVRRQVVEFRPFRATALDSRKVWATALLDLKNYDGADAYLRGTRLLTRDGAELLVGTASAYAAAWLQRRVAHRAAQLLSALGGERVAVRFVAETDWLNQR